MKCIKKQIPNLLTLCRLVLTLVCNMYICISFNEIIIPCVITILVFLSDFFDGRLARKLNSETRIGAIFDVAVDCFYILSTYYVLSYFGVLPIWFINIIILKFIEFNLTSLIMNKLNGVCKTYVFDILGRIVSGFFYIIPIIAYIMFCIHSSLYNYLNIMLYVNCILSISSSAYRIYACGDVIRQRIINENRYN